MENDNVIMKKSYDFALRIIKVYKYLRKKEVFILSKQLLRSGAFISVNVVEALDGISRKDFRNKISIALKEAVESRYWISLLKGENYLSSKQAQSLINSLNEIINILVKIGKNAN